MPLPTGATLHQKQPFHYICVLLCCQHFCSRQKRSRLFSCSGDIGRADIYRRFKKWVLYTLLRDQVHSSCRTALAVASCSFSPVCDRTLLGKKVKKRNCLELYEFQDGNWRPAEVGNSTKRKYNNESKFVSSFHPFIYTFGLRNKWVFCSFCCSDEGLHLLPLLWT